MGDLYIVFKNDDWRRIDAGGSLIFKQKHMEIWEYILLFVTVFLGGSTGFLFPKERKGLLQIVLSFSGAYILGIAVLHLMPWVFGSGDSKMGLFVLLGFFVQLLLEQLSEGVEHGHMHAPHKLSAGFMFSVMFGLCVHALVEGIPLSYYGIMHETNHGGHTHTHNHLLYGIIMHHIPAAFALVFLLIISKLRKVWIWVCLALRNCSIRSVFLAILRSPIIKQPDIVLVLVRIGAKI